MAMYDPQILLASLEQRISNGCRLRLIHCTVINVRDTVLHFYVERLVAMVR